MIFSIEYNAFSVSCFFDEILYSIFMIAFYRFLQTIPQGKVMTYKSIAEHFHIHPRKVAILLRQNTQPDLYPCYKIIHHDGRIGGYNGGVNIKRRKLEVDGIVIDNDIIDKKYIRHPVVNK